MAGTLRARSRRNLDAPSGDNVAMPSVNGLEMDSPSGDIEVYSKEVLNALIADNLPPTPNNFSLYFDRLLEDKSESLRKQILALLELEEANGDENINCEGLLLYPTVVNELAEECDIQGHRIMFRTINLNQEWRAIHDDLLAIVD